MHTVYITCFNFHFLPHVVSLTSMRLSLYETNEVFENIRDEEYRNTRIVLLYL